MQSRGFLSLPLLLGVLAVLALSGGAWWYTQSRQVAAPQPAGQEAPTLLAAPDITTLQFTFEADAFTLQEKDGYWLSDKFGDVTKGTNRAYSLLTSVGGTAEAGGTIGAMRISAMVISRHTGNNIFTPYLYVFAAIDGTWQQAAYTQLPPDGGRTTLDAIAIVGSTIVLDVKTSGPERNYHETYVPKRYTYALQGGQLVLQNQLNNSQSALTASPSSGPAPLYLYFNTGDTAHGSYFVDFGDGMKGNMYQSEVDCSDQWCVSHTYQNPGTYTAKLYSGATVQDKGIAGTISGTPILLGTVTVTATGPQSILSVPGMSQYTDADFGFSFWYPTGWAVELWGVTNPSQYAGGSISKILVVGQGRHPNRTESITIEEFYSPTREIATPADRCSPMQGYTIPAKRYYFDTTLRTWMVEVSATTQYSERDGSQYITPTSTEAADVSHNTMGGLHEFSFGCAGKVIPLSAHNFLVFSYFRNVSPPYYSYLADTIVATDPAVATPVSTARQTQIIDIVGKIFRGDRQSYQVKGWLEKSGNDWVLKEANKDGVGRTGSVFTLHFNDKSTCTLYQPDPRNNTTFACLGAPTPSWGWGDRVTVNMEDVFSSDITVRWMYIKSGLPISEW